MPATTRRLQIGLAMLAFAGLMFLWSASLRAVPPPGWEPTFADDFGGGVLSWDMLRGAWRVDAGALEGEASQPGHDAMAYPQGTALASAQHVEVTVTPRQRLAKDGWTFAGVALGTGGQDLWLLALTEDPTGEKYVDFLERLQGVWQAQGKGASKLDLEQTKSLTPRWAYDRAYRLELTLDAAGITAAVRDVSGDVLLFQGRYPFGKAPALREGFPGLMLRGASAGFDDASVWQPAPPPAAEVGITVEQGAQGNVAIFAEDLPETRQETVTAFAAAFRKAGFGVTLLPAQAATRLDVLTRRAFDLYVITNAPVYPAAAFPALTNYLRGGGNLVLQGAPPFSRPVVRHNDGWLDRAGLAAAVQKLPVERVLFAFDGPEDNRGWQRKSNALDAAGKAEIDGSGANDSAGCLKVTTENLTGWDTYTCTPPDGTPGLFAAGHQALCFWAKGDADTPEVSVELTETDGARWYAPVPLTQEWSYHVLLPDDFRFWPDCPVRDTRGGDTDALRCGAAASITFGLAGSLTPKVKNGAHTYWIDQVGTAANPFGAVTEALQRRLMPLESIHPAYKLYALNGVHTLRPAPGQAILGETGPLAATADLRASYFRPQGKGFAHGQLWRWVPLLEASNAAGRRLGAPLWLILNRAFPLSGSGVLCLAADEPGFVTSGAVLSSVMRAASWLCQGAVLLDAGSASFSCRPGEAVQLGATLRNRARVDRNVSIRIRIASKATDTEAFAHAWEVALKPAESATVRGEWTGPKAAGDVFDVQTELMADGVVVDHIRHELSVLPDTPPAPEDFITVEGANFQLKGKPWYPVGMNFWPLYTSALESGEYNTGWLDSRFYDPVEVDRDLRRMAALGINMVSIQLGDVENAANLEDFLQHCSRYDIRVNGFLGGASPIDFDEPKARAMIEAAHLRDHTALFAYDIIWEPGNYVFNAKTRNRWDPDWAAWLDERYGSLENAERDWGMPVPRRDGNPTSPSDDQLRRDGDWRVLVAAYRRFMDDLTSRKWNDAIRALRALDPNHLVSFRQGNTLPHDFALTGPVKHIDFICPEAYSIELSADGFNAAGFITRFCDFTTGGKPVIWAEFGTSIWSQEAMAGTPELLERQTQYHDMMYRMAIDAGANGTVPWWWPGGYRVNERSDFGVCNSDGTPRPAAELLRTYVPALKKPRARLTGEQVLIFDRDAHAGGYWFLAFNTGKEAYAAARAAGKVLALRTEATNTDSVGTPAVAVGNRPCDGRNPPKYLNAEFNTFEVQDTSGAWVDVRHVKRVSVFTGEPVLARGSIGNTQEAAWLRPEAAGGLPGAVYLSGALESKLTVSIPLRKTTPSLGDALLPEFVLTSGITERTEVVLQMEAKGRMRFGEKLAFTLEPAGN
ncbi:MAG: hypothetical protein A3K18_12420 [Lentisphaerae bacterium RIFOXYA12_64_32]|nr:MAG: hypothetical protein A3K18_12420 [Lentisphaerae bacterium RIFOXYA12_64_32]